MVRAVRTPGQTLSVVPDSLRVATRGAVVDVRAVTCGAVGMATHAFPQLLAGKEARRTVIRTLVLVEEVVTVTVWKRGGGEWPLSLVLLLWENKGRNLSDVNKDGQVYGQVDIR